MCGCCYPRGTPPGAAPVKGRDTGIFIWALAVGGGLSILLAAVAGWYFLPRKKASRVWPERIKPPDPRPVAEQSFAKILDQFQLELQNNPALVKNALEKNFHLKALPDAEKKIAIEDMKKNPETAKKFFTRRSVQYLLACEEGAGTSSQGSRSPKSPTSPSSRQSRSGPEPHQLSFALEDNLVNTQDMQVTSPHSRMSGNSRPSSQGAIGWQDVSAISDAPPLADTGDLRQLADASDADAPSEIAAP